jgi:hypothetical protein
MAVKHHIKGGVQAKGFSLKDPEVNIWVQKGQEWVMEKVPQ